MGADAEGRVVVTDILETSDAYRRGLRYDDEIVSFGGRPISTPNGFKNVLGIFPKGWRVPLSYRREGKRYDILVRLAGVHGQEELLEKAAGRPPVEPMPIPKPDEEPKPAPHRAESRESSRRSCRARSPQAARRRSRAARCRRSSRSISRRNAAMPTTTSTRSSSSGSGRRGAAGTNPDAAKGAWTLAGQLAQGGEFRFELTDGGASLKLPDAARRSGRPSDELGASLLPAHSGGLLPALYLWRRLAVEGLGRFGEVDYYGTAPLAGHEGWSTCWSARTRAWNAASTSTRPRDTCWRWRCSPTRTPIRARSISPTTARWTGGFGRGGWKSATATSCLRRSR